MSKILPSSETGREVLFEPFDEHSFHFECHSRLSCFTKCCAKLRLVLTPYDILRIKKALGLSSADFLDRYTEVTFDESCRFPLVRLKMNQNREKTCPFVGPKGCSIYHDRPSSCRLYPLGRASTIVDAKGTSKERFFLVHEAHCLGFHEKKSWNLTQWLSHEGMDSYLSFNDDWLRVVGSDKNLKAGPYAHKKIRMFFMASYNLDRFRDFILGSSFLDLFDIEAEVKERLCFDDEMLLRFAVHWLSFSLFGEDTLRLKKDRVL